MINITTMIACGVQPTQARTFAQPLADACQRFGITTREQQAAFIAQAMHESINFTHMEESLYYRDPARIVAVWPKRFANAAVAAPLARNPQALANRVYGLRMGNTAPDDGWRYRGRGVFQLTGKANYRAASDALGQDFVASPDLVAQPVAAALTAGWYWDKSGCSEALAAGGIDSVTRAINGGMTGAAERRKNYAACLAAMD